MRNLKITQKITNRPESKSFNRYMVDVRAIKPFVNADEEYECAMRASKGDENAMNELINRNLKFVISVSKQYSGRKYPLDELVTQGNYGLIEAARKFEPSRGFKFISYAVWHIRKNVIDYINKNHELIRLPINKINNLSKIRQEISNLEQLHQRDVFNSDLLFSDNVDFKLKDIDNLMAIDSINVASLDSPISSDSDSSNLIDVIVNKNIENSDYLINDADIKDLMDNIMSVLSEREKKIINLHYGLNGHQPLSLIEIGEKIEMSREGVRKIRAKALRILKVTMRKKGIKLDMFI